ncbi:PEPxxWA-CTERM sorting domain-containing protein [Sandarakinorhabdus sp.]|uniref:PEPxxWA-CTERM sorting domain-containing protein n=1 Tax=Sandarakinorhabdus sp. TaxID=1916663 RepID=UPI00286DC918|nr:PEPxxWA-CTERM sorting domain-containing protein [Sandarakinorhabdus sp.]
MLAAAAVPSQAAVTLSFDDIPDRGTPGQFYNGGRAIDQFGQQSGNPGPAFGISIQGFATVLEQLRLCPGGIPCGSTVIPKPPSGLKVLSAPFERNDFNRTLFNLARGFTDEISFWIYVPGGALAAPASVTIFANEGGYTASANPILGFVSVPAPTNCVFATSPITTVSGCGFTKFTMAFSGAARSVLFQGAVFDDITIGAPGGGAVPEPASWAMLIAGFGLTGAAMRRRRAALTV